MEEFAYEKGLSRIVSKNTVRRFKVTGVDPDVFDRCEEGCYYGSGFSAVYSKVPQKGDSTNNAVIVTVDSRLKPEIFSFKKLSSCPPVLSITVHSGKNVVDCILSVDLGNTRTSVLIVDQINAPVSGDGGIAFYELPLYWTHMPGNCNCMIGTFESVISLNHSHEDISNGLKLSFMRLGAQAVYNNRESALHKRASDGVFSISSPKRYFFDERNVVSPWLASATSGNAKETVCRELSGPLAASLSKGSGGSAEISRISPSSMLSGMLVEIYEQACHFISSKSFSEMSKNSTPRKISHIHVTYPSTFSKHEQEFYRRKLQQGIDAYLEHYRDPAPGEIPPSVQVVSSIDEATAVLAFYTHCEIKKAGFASVWTATVGRPVSAVSPIPSQVRIGVVDVGGGTTDLAIANILPTGTPDQPTAANIQVLYQDGINEAGDNFLGTFIKSVVFAKGVGALAFLYGVDVPDVLGHFKTVYNEKIGLFPTLSHDFWFALAIGFASHLDHLWERGYDREKKHFSFPNDAASFEFRISEDVTGPWDQIFKAYDSSRSLRTLKAGTVLKLNVSEEDVAQYVETIRTVFLRAAKTFGRVITAFDCDQVLFAGKTSVLFAVRQIFEGNMPVPVVLSMNDYYAGDWCSLSRSGVVPDAKVSTAMGGAFCALKEIGAQNSIVHLSFERGQVLHSDGYQWGVIADPKQPPMIIRANEIKDDNGVLTLFLGCTPLYIVRKRTGCIGTATLCYELSAKAGAPQIKRAVVRLRIVRNSQEDGAKLTLDNVEGDCQNGMKVNIDMISLRICSFTGGKFWMDDGRI